MKSTRSKHYLPVLLSAALCFAGVASAATQTIGYSWTIPTTRVDGSALAVTELAGYAIYYTIDGGATQRVSVALGTSTGKSFPLSLPPKAAGYILTSSVTAIDTDGLESAQSTPVVTKLTIQNALPAPPSNLKLSVTCANGSCSLVVQ